MWKDLGDFLTTALEVVAGEKSSDALVTALDDMRQSGKTIVVATLQACAACGAEFSRASTSTATACDACTAKEPSGAAS